MGNSLFGHGLGGIRPPQQRKSRCEIYLSRGQWRWGSSNTRIPDASIRRRDCGRSWPTSRSLGQLVQQSLISYLQR